MVDVRKDPFYKVLRFLEENGRGDPNVSLFLGVLTGDTDLTKQAVDEGASINVTDNALINYHLGFLEKRCPEVLASYFEKNKINQPDDDA